MDSLYLVASEKPKFTQSHLQNTLILLPWCPHTRQSTGLVFLLPKCKQSKLNILPKNVPEKVDALKANFTERFRILKETNPEILPVYSNPKQKPAKQLAEQPKDAAEFTCQEPGCGKICSPSGGLKNHTRKHRRGGRQATAIH